VEQIVAKLKAKAMRQARQAQFGRKKVARKATIQPIKKAINSFKSINILKLLDILRQQPCLFSLPLLWSLTFNVL